ncbi:hypothetical protein K456DRAFT_176205 [Colletotrichum gloeosporioides 23]|nr:hypothetical protein K456DRAFT_176205 [Colletotrichum gloeosporioides 23]
MECSSVQCLDRLSKSDIIIAVFGITGSGKSTFISTLTELDTSVGHNLTSRTWRHLRSVFSIQARPTDMIQAWATVCNHNDLDRTDHCEQGHPKSASIATR